MLERLWQEVHKFEASLDNSVRSYLKIKKGGDLALWEGPAFNPQYRERGGEDTGDKGGGTSCEGRKKEGRKVGRQEGSHKGSQASRQVGGKGETDRQTRKYVKNIIKRHFKARCGIVIEYLPSTHKYLDKRETLYGEEEVEETPSLNGKSNEIAPNLWSKDFTSLLSNTLQCFHMIIMCHLYCP